MYYDVWENLGMNKKNTIAINVHFINNRIKELGLKRSWLAVKIGVSKKTISRWTTGKVKRIAYYNAHALARCLNTSVEELSNKSDIYVLGTQLDKELAANKIISEDLLLLLSPSGKWDLLESIIKSSISPNLSKEKIGRLYNWLSITKWRKKSYKEARAFAREALKIGNETNDKAISVKALFNLGTVESLSGNNHIALENYLRCYKLKDYFKTRSDVASLCTNISMVYRDMGDFELSLEYQKEAVKLFDFDKKYYNLSIAFQCFGYIYTEIGHFDKAIENLNIAIDYAYKSNYNLGLVTIPLYKLDVLALSNNFHKIDNDIIINIKKFLDGNYNDPFCFEYISRYYRVISKEINAEKTIQRGLKQIGDNPVAMASLWHERSRLALWQNDLEGEKLYRKKGNNIYKSIGLSKRVADSQILEYGKGFSL